MNKFNEQTCLNVKHYTVSFSTYRPNACKHLSRLSSCECLQVQKTMTVLPQQHFLATMSRLLTPNVCWRLDGLVKLLSPYTGRISEWLLWVPLPSEYDDTTTHSTTTEVIEITICVRFDYDTTTTRLRRKIDMFIFLLASNRVEWKQVRAIRRSRIVVVS